MVGGEGGPGCPKINTGSKGSLNCFSKMPFLSVGCHSLLRNAVHRESYVEIKRPDVLRECHADILFRWYPECSPALVPPSFLEEESAIAALRNRNEITARSVGAFRCQALTLSPKPLC